MSDVKVAKVKLYNAKLKAGFLDHEIDEEDVILPSEAVGSLNLKNGDEVTFEVLQKDGRYYATNVKAK
ncbi:cold shock domain-containing protein [Pseudomonas faucium]|uniref:cold shock domain-containing protein n=1 Tax=Pseudomonas faucium TaxID=2740518 RepID=UPI001596B966|nr:cold shock domain-containing protein [Pseudomonas faucium]